MSTIVLYYSYSGHTKAAAEKIASQTGATLCRVEEVQKRGKFSAFLRGCPAALHRRASKIRDIPYDLQNFDQIWIGAPIWAGFPAPAFNAIVEKLPAGKTVSLFFCSASGDSSKSAAGTRAKITEKGCKVDAYQDLSSSSVK